MRDEQPRRFFVTLSGFDATDVPRLMDMDLDLFDPRELEGVRQFDGLITLDELERLVKAGFEVLVRGTDEPKRELERTNIVDWLEAMQADLERQRKG